MDDEPLVRPESPFLRSRPHDKRPKLRFQSPQQTEEWLASREKTDYTYSKSASYSESKAEGSLSVITNNYPTPIMSRRAGQGIGYNNTDGAAESSMYTGTRRASARLANRRGYAAAETPSLGVHNEYCDSTTTTTSVYTEDDPSRYDATDCSTTSSLSTTIRGRLLFTGGEQYNEKQLDHLYGLDQDEMSDTESTSVIYSRSSSPSSFSSQRSFAASNLVMRSITLVCSVISIVVSTTFQVFKTVVVEPVKIIGRSMMSSSESSHMKQKSQTLSNLREIFSSIVSSVSSWSSYREERHQRRRRRRTGAFCCWLLLLALLGSGILFGVYSYLFTSTSQKEPEITSFHDINKNLDKVIGNLLHEETTVVGGTEGGGTEGGGTDGGGTDGGGVFVGIDEIKALIAAEVQKEITVVNNLVLGQQKKLQYQEHVITELQDRISKMQDGQTVIDINNLDVRVTQLHNDMRNVKFLKEGLTWEDMFQSVKSEIGTLSIHHTQLVAEVEQFQKMLNDISPSFDERFAHNDKLLTQSEQRLTNEISQLGTQLKSLEAQLDNMLKATAPNNDDIKQLVAMMNIHDEDMTKLRVDLRAVQSKVSTLSDNDKGDAIQKSLATLHTDVADLSGRIGQVETSVGQQAITVSNMQNVTFKIWDVKLENLNKDIITSQQNLSTTVQLMQDDLGSMTSQVSGLGADIIQLKQVNLDHQQEILTIRKTPLIQDPHLSADSKLLVSQLSEETNVLKRHFQSFSSNSDTESEQQRVDAINKKIEMLTVKVGNIQKGVVEDGEVVSRTTLQHMSSLVGEITDVQQQLDDLQVTGQLPGEAEHWENAKKSLGALSAKLAMLRKHVDSLALLRTDLDFVMVDEIPQLKRGVVSNKRDLLSKLGMVSNEYNTKVNKLDTKFTVLLESYSTAQNSGTVASGEILLINGKIADLQTDLNNLKGITNEIENLKSNIAASQNDARQKLVDLDGRVANLGVPSGLVNKLAGIDEVQQGISHDMNQLKEGIVEIKGHLQVSGTTGWFDVSLLDERVKALEAQIGIIQGDLLKISASGDAPKHPAGLEADLLNLKQDIMLLNTVLGVSSDTKQGQSTLATLQQRLAVLEESINGDEKQSEFAFDVSKASEDVILLRSNIEKLAASVSAVESVVSAANLEALRSDVTNIQRVFEQLQLDLTKCCKNGSAMAALFMSDESSGILDFLMSRFIGRHELDLTKQPLSADSLNASDNLDLQVIRGIVNDIMLVNNADKTGIVDFALESAGGSVISTRCSKTYSTKTALVSIFGIPLWYSGTNPRMVIQPDVNPGNCWAFVGTHGFMVIQLSGHIKITSFSLEHIPKSLSRTGNIDSAPNNFSVIGLDQEYDSEGTELGRYTYDQNGNPIQFFTVQKPNSKAFHIVELRIHSNHGNMDYTCLYRFRVHGILQK